MKVFISWSGERSKEVARALRQWFPRVFQSVDPWMSEKDIMGGSLWLNEVMEGLKGAQFGVVCVTPENQDQPWIHFEAGAIAKQIDSRNYVCPYLISMQGFELQHNPLTNFQYKQADEQGTRELVESMNRVLEKPLPQDDLQETFGMWWPRLHEKLSNIPEPVTRQVEKRSTEDMVEEILEVVRELARSSSNTRSFGELRLSDIFPNMPSSDLSPAEVQRLKAAIHEMLGTLSPIHQTVLRMRYGLDGEIEYPYGEIAATLGISYKKVRDLEAEALRELKHPNRSKHTP
jgi:hypothetical protein